MGILAGLALALIAVYLVLQPLLREASGRAVVAAEPLFSDSDDEDDPALARRDRALAALKEIDFDRATGKLSDEDYGKLKEEFTAEALEALRAADAPTLPRSHAPTNDVPTDDAVEALIASARAPAAAMGRFCLECGAPLSGSLRFCLECGTPAGAVPT